MNNKKTVWTVVAIVVIVIAIASLKAFTNKGAAPVAPSTGGTPSAMTPESPMPASSPTPAHTPAPAPHPVATPAPAPISGTAYVVIKNFSFIPSNVKIKKGTKVIWVNNDTTTHTIVADAGTGVGMNSDKLTPGDSYAYTFPNAGTFTYHCGLHPSMIGTVTVTD